MGRDKSNTNNNRQTKKEKMAEKKAKKAEQFDITHGKNKVRRNTGNQNNGDKNDVNGNGSKQIEQDHN
ncbi:uncharacterized protein L201_005980 [Kwoniella dendrophila CBS 6074]|uniref:Small EDRK-rich factor-like N-terminal domain-containing protein n=1 Tax=Kwoniella dendrophila CBS 6074 TaxID=1295534 RepID=A0AAX4K2Q2_9TREE